jgi:hypothetical protein
MRAAVEDGAALGAEHAREACSLAAVIAKAALERGPEPLSAAFGLEDPGSDLERGPVTGMTPVAAGEFDDPLARLVEVVADDLTLHQ